MMKKWHGFLYRKKKMTLLVHFIYKLGNSSSRPIVDGPLDVSTWISHRYIMLSMSKPELFPFPSPQHMLFLGSPSWWMELLPTSHSVQRNLAVILNTLTFLTSSIQAFSRFPPNVLCHSLSVTIGFHIPGSSGCSYIFVWLWPLYRCWCCWRSLPNEKVFFSFDIFNITLSY